MVKESKKNGADDMKHNPNYILHKRADTSVIVPIGGAARDFPGMITVNETGAMLWEMLDNEHTEAELVAALHDRYDEPQSRLAADVQEFLRSLRQAYALAEDVSV
jgi:hypothetical protein